MIWPKRRISPNSLPVFLPDVALRADAGGRSAVSPVTAIHSSVARPTTPRCTLRAIACMSIFLPLLGACSWQSGAGVAAAASVVREVILDQVIANLFATRSDPYALPGHVELRDGEVNRAYSISPSIQPGIDLRGIAVTGFGLSGSIVQNNNIGINPITDVFPLRRLQLVYRHAVWGQATDTGRSFRETYAGLLAPSDEAQLSRLPELEQGPFVLFDEASCRNNPTREVRLADVLCFSNRARNSSPTAPEAIGNFNDAFRRRADVILWVLASMQFAATAPPQEVDRPAQQPQPPAPTSQRSLLGPRRSETPTLRISPFGRRLLLD